MKLPLNLDKFVIWFFYRVPKRMLMILFRILEITNNEVAFTLNLRLLFTPLFGDYTIIGRLMGFIFRVVRIAVGLVVTLIVFVMMLTLPVLWTILPVLLIKEVGGFAFLYIIFVYFSFEWINHGRPEKKAVEVQKDPNRDLADLQDCLSESAVVLPLFTGDPSTEVTRFLQHSNAIYILSLLEVSNDPFVTTLTQLISESKFDKKDVLERAFNFALENKARYIEPEHVLLSLIEKIAKRDSVLTKNGITFESVKGCVYWAVSEKDEKAKIFFWQPDYSPRPIGGVNRGWTGRVTHDLDAVSEDFTKRAQKGLIDQVVGKDKAISQTIDALSKGTSNNVLIIGEPGSGKTTMVKGLANEIVFGTSVEQLKFKRLVSLEVGALIAGCKSPGEVSERLEKIIDDIKGSGNIILFVDEIHNLVASSGGDNAQLSTVFSTLEPHLSSGEFQFIGATSIPEYRRYIEPNGAFTRLFQVITLDEASKEDTLKILRLLLSKFRKIYKVEISYMAIYKTIELSSKLIRDRVLPDKAVDILERACVAASKKKRPVTTELIKEVVSEMTKIPVTSVDESESKKLLNIEDVIKTRVVGQDSAVYQVADALRRARSGMRDEKRPIASFLFVGSTGVGKTETAKAISDVYFGSEGQMIRVDMSEYQKDDSVDKLIGTSDGKTIGFLTDKVRRSPFSLILLDEIEKASPKVLLLFLQVLDDARLTDSTGRVVDFTNSIIIATSNAGTQKIQEVLAKDGTYEDMQKAAMEELRNRFVPEFLNRFSGIVTFKPLYPAEIEKITVLLLEKVRKNLDAKGISASFDPSLVAKLAKDGFDPQWGARPLRRLIENTVESSLARKLLAQEIGPGDSLVIDTSYLEQRKY